MGATPKRIALGTPLGMRCGCLAPYVVMHHAGGRAVEHAGVNEAPSIDIDIGDAGRRPLRLRGMSLVRMLTSL